MLTEEEEAIIRQAEADEYSRLMAAEEERHHAEARLQQDLENAAEFLLAHKPLPEAIVFLAETHEMVKPVEKAPF